jgi:hypothetical protein
VWRNQQDVMMKQPEIKPGYTADASNEKGGHRAERMQLEPGDAPDYGLLCMRAGALHQRISGLRQRHYSK